jgi:hypothetical protein
VSVGRRLKLLTGIPYCPSSLILSPALRPTMRTLLPARALSSARSRSPLILRTRSLDRRPRARRTRTRCCRADRRHGDDDVDSREGWSSTTRTAYRERWNPATTIGARDELRGQLGAEHHRGCCMAWVPKDMQTALPARTASEPDRGRAHAAKMLGSPRPTRGSLGVPATR